MKNLVILVFLSVILTGCSAAAVKAKVMDNNVEKQQDSVVDSLQGDIGFKLLEDKRPDKDVYYMTSIREKVSEQIVDELKKYNIFSKMRYPAQDNDDIVIGGEIRRFYTNTYETMLSYIPVINVFTLFGLPANRVYSEVDIYLEIMNNKNKEVILSFQERYVENQKYSIYSSKPSGDTEDLSKCFNVVLNRIKQRILINRDKIVNFKKKPEQDIVVGNAGNFPPQKIDEQKKDGN